MADGAVRHRQDDRVLSFSIQRAFAAQCDDNVQQAKIRRDQQYISLSHFSPDRAGEQALTPSVPGEDDAVLRLPFIRCLRECPLKNLPTARNSENRH